MGASGFLKSFGYCVGEGGVRSAKARQDILDRCFRQTVPSTVEASHTWGRPESRERALKMVRTLESLADRCRRRADALSGIGRPSLTTRKTSGTSGRPTEASYPGRPRSRKYPWSGESWSLSRIVVSSKASDRLPVGPPSTTSRLASRARPIPPDSVNTLLIPGFSGSRRFADPRRRGFAFL